MIRIVAVMAVAAAALSTGSSPTRAQQENRPGFSSVGQVQVLNRSAADAVAVRVVNDRDPIPTTIVGVPTVAVTATAGLDMRAARQRWEYRQVPLRPAGDPVEALNAAGAEGWEAVGVIAGEDGRGGVLLKRPR